MSDADWRQAQGDLRAIRRALNDAGLDQIHFLTDDAQRTLVIERNPRAAGIQLEWIASKVDQPQGIRVAIEDLATRLLQFTG